MRTELKLCSDFPLFSGETGDDPPFVHPSTSPLIPYQQLLIRYFN